MHETKSTLRITKNFNAKLYSEEPVDEKAQETIINNIQVKITDEDKTKYEKQIDMNDLEQAIKELP